MEKTKIVCCFFLFGLFFWLLPPAGEAQVAVNCSTQSLQTAISDNARGTTFTVTGICNENITISELRERTTINGGGTATINGPDTANATVYVRGQEVTITGFTITGGSDGITVLRGGTATISNNTIQNTGGSGINVAMNSFARITNSTISNNPGNGISVYESSSARVGFISATDTVASPNTIESSGDNGIWVGRASSARIVGNTIRNNTNNGVTVSKNSQADISNNTINNNGANGIQVRESSIVNLGNRTGTTIFDLPNFTTVNNANLGVYCAIGAYVVGRLGTLNGVNGDIDTGEIGFSGGWFDNGGGLDIRAASDGLIQLGNSSAQNTTKAARMVVRHYDNNEESVYLFGAASTSTNNFVAFGGGSPLGNAATQLDLFTALNTTTPVGTSRLTIIGNGNVGIGIQAPAYPLHMVSGAHVTAGGVWTDASSREYKDNIKGLKVKDALETLQGLNPVTFSYKVSPEENHVGFVAEEVPDLVSTKDRKGLSPMDIVAVLTKVLQEQQKTISALSEELKELKEKVR